MLTTAISVACGSVAAVVTVHGAWWTVLSAVALPPPRRRLDSHAVRSRIVVIVPAHNEERLLGRTLESLAAATAPDDQRPEVLVVADNCTDGTSGVARQHGATVLERDDPDHRGKSFAVEHALARLRTRDQPPDVVAFVDADSTVSPNFFAAIDDALVRGADAVQVHYAAAPGGDNLVALRRLAFSLLHWSRPLGATRLGLGVGLKGNGMALRWGVAAGGLGGSGLTEDAAMTLALVQRGIAVRFVPGATVTGHMAGTYAEASVQDRRWEGGRFALVPRALTATVEALARGDIACAAPAAEVASLPLTLLAAGAALCLVAAGAGAGPAWLLIAAPLSLTAYVVTGLVAARAPVHDLRALVSAPRFVAHKLRVYGSLAVRRQSEWQRTHRA